MVVVMVIIMVVAVIIVIIIDIVGRRALTPSLSATLMVVAIAHIFTVTIALRARDVHEWGSTGGVVGGRGWCRLE
jgi:hypothetical protein